MLFRTEIEINPLEQTIVYGDGLLFLGSCFADEVGHLCRGLGFDAMVNPFGALYNPLSIAQSLHRLQTGSPFTPEEVVSVGEGFYCTFSHNTEFWNPSPEALLEKVNVHLAEAHQHLLKSQWLVISLGTSFVYRRHDTHEVVCNCHKLPAKQFDREFLDPDITVSALSGLLEAFPDKQLVFTVSPLRHLKDGLHENQLSKAALLLATDKLCQSFPNAHYFPAYEILLDELRDYRFYKEDMVHPTEQAVQYVWDRFVDYAIDPSQKPAMKMASELKVMLHHQPLFPESASFQKFEELKSSKSAALANAYPNVLIRNL